jgi:hypothetical protein
MGLHQILKLLHIKGNNYQNQVITHRMGKSSVSYSTDKRINIQNVQKTEKN